MRMITEEMLKAFREHLVREERSPGTIEKYLRDAGALVAYLRGGEVTKERVAQWKEDLLRDRAPGTVNSMLSAVNSLFRFLGWEECKVRFLRIQRQLFRRESRELSRGEYQRLLATAQRLGQARLALLMEAICATGIRVSELQYLTVEAARTGRTSVSLKGKIRVILLPGKLCRKLLKYAKKQKIVSGEIFLTRNGNSLSRKQIWAEMKALCQAAGVAPSKVFPHNLRHLFARLFYNASRDVAKLADILGHSSIETTRIYLISTGSEHRHEMERLDLVS